MFTEILQTLNGKKRRLVGCLKKNPNPLGQKIIYVGLGLVQVRLQQRDLECWSSAGTGSFLRPPAVSLRSGARCYFTFLLEVKPTCKYDETNQPDAYR